MLSKFLKSILLILVLFSFFITCGCSDKSGAIKDPLPSPIFTTPTISNLVLETSELSKSVGGILILSCEWTSPNIVSTATAYISFVNTLTATNTAPVGVMPEGADDDEDDYEIRFQEEPPEDTTELELFYERFAEPIVIPSSIGTSKTHGTWSAQIPFTIRDLKDAPLGIQQMMLYKKINGVKTNTLSFEITFLE